MDQSGQRGVFAVHEKMRKFTDLAKGRRRPADRKTILRKARRVMNEGFLGGEMGLTPFGPGAIMGIHPAGVTPSSPTAGHLLEEVATIALPARRTLPTFHRTEDRCMKYCHRNPIIRYPPAGIGQSWCHRLSSR